MLHIQTKLKYAIVFAIGFAIITGVAFLAGLSLAIQFAPSPVAQALTDLFAFAPIITVAALILSFIETFVILWLAVHHKKWLWPIALLLSIVFGGLASFFSLFSVWALVGIANLVLIFIMVRFLELRQLKENGVL